LNVLLINPPWHQKTGNMWRHIKSCVPPFGLALIASVLEGRGHRVSILDCNAERIGLDRLRESLPQGGWDFVGVSSTTPLFPNALAVARNARELFPGARVVLGGVHPSVFPEEALAAPEIDFVVRREGEETFTELVEGKEAAGIPGLSWKDGPVPVHNPDRPARPTITDLPLMAYHLLPMGKYGSALGSYLRTPSIGMMVSRGCPGRCTYCFGPYLGKKVRFRTADQIVEEIELLTTRYGIREISFYDDTFTTFPALVQEVCRTLLDRKVDLTWSCFSRVDRVDQDTLLLMRKAGCHQIMYGIESADPQILKNINKRIDLARAREVVRLTRKAGIRVRAAFMLGNPGETEESMRRTTRFAKELRPDFVVYNITTPFPGSEMFAWAEGNGHLLTRDWEKYDLATAVLDLPTVGHETVRRAYRAAYRGFYLRPSYVARRLLGTRSWQDIKMNWYAFKSLVS